jgi:hypothetical protein
MKKRWPRSTPASATASDSILLGTDLGVFDLDKCRDPVTGSVAPEAMSIVYRSVSYTEITPSGTGLRVIGRGIGAKVHRKQKIRGCTLKLGQRRSVPRGRSELDQQWRNYDDSQSVRREPMLPSNPYRGRRAVKTT